MFPGERMSDQGARSDDPRDAAEDRALELARTNAELEAFAHAVAHDLKAPLRGITLITEFLTEDAPDLPPQVRTRVARLAELATRAERMIGSLLEHARAARGDLVLRDTQLAEAAAAAIEHVRGTLGRAGDIEIAGPLPRARCDPAAIGRVLSELIGNGLTYNRASRRRIEIRAREAEREVVVSVQDNGVGLNPARAGVAFRMFGRAHAREEFGESIGAGLAISRRIIERHGGRIWFEAAEGGGTVFSFTLPRGASDAAPPASPGPA